MTKISNPPEIDSANEQKLVRTEDFLQQDEQEFLQYIQSELNQLVKEPSELIIKNILTYARFF